MLRIFYQIIHKAQYFLSKEWLFGAENFFMNRFNIEIFDKLDNLWHDIYNQNHNFYKESPGQTFRKSGNQPVCLLERWGKSQDNLEREETQC